MSYIKTSWQDLPNQTTPINATNLNKIEQGIYDATYVNGVNVGNSVDSNYKVNFVHSRNLFDGVIEQGGFDNSGLPQDNATRVRSANFIAVKPNTTYTVTVPSNMKVIINFYNASTSSSTRIGQTDGWVNVQRTFTTPANTNYIKLLIGKQNDSNITPSEVTNVMLNIGGTALSYEPYIPSSINVDGYKFTDTLNVGTESFNAGVWIDTDIVDLGEFEQGAIGHTLGTTFDNLKVASSTRIRTKNLVKLDSTKVYKVSFNSKYNVVYQVFDDENKNIDFTGSDVWNTNTFYISGVSSACFAIRNNDNSSNITPSELGQIQLSVMSNPNIKIYNNGLYETIDNKNIYSTEEAVIGKWFGKPLYRKVFSFNNPTSASSLGSSGISPANVTKIDALGTQANANVGGRIPLGYGGFGVQIDANGNFYYTNPNYTFSNLSITVEYIKTTDTVTRSLNTIEQTRSVPTESTQDDER